MITEAIATILGSISLSGAHPRDPAIARMLGMGMQNKAGAKVDHDTVIALPAIKRAVQIITDKLYGMPWYVFREQVDGREFDRSHRAWHCVHRMANSEISAQALRQQLTQWAMIYGNGCAYIDRSGPRIELIPLLPDRTSIIRITEQDAQVTAPEQRGQLYYRTRIGGEIRLFERSEVLHIKGMGPNPYWGWDIIELLVECFGGALAREEFSNRFFSNGANPVGFITMDGSLDEESEETYMQSLTKAMSGLGKAHKVILLEEGAKFQAVTVDPIKSQMLEGKQFDVRQLAMAIGIKPHKLIDGANSAFASLEQANHEHKDDDIMPWVNKWRCEYESKLLNSDEMDSGSHSIDLDDEALDWVPFSERASGSVELYNNGLIDKDEGRRKVNFGPSRAARAKAFRIPSNIVYEDDMQAVVGGQQEQQQQPQDQQATEQFEEVAAAYLGKIEKRLLAQAKAKAKNSGEFLSWLDSLTTEEGPKAIQPRIDELYKTTIERFNTLVNTVTAEELSNAI